MNKLKEGISIVYDLELNNYLMNKSIRKLNYSIKNLCIPQKYDLPEKKETVESVGKLGTSILFGLGGAVIGFIASLFSSKSFLAMAKLGGLFLAFDRLSSSLAVSAKFALVGCIIGIVLSILTIPLLAKSAKDDAKKAEDEYNNKLLDYQRKVKKDKIRLANEKKQRDILIQQRDILIKRKKAATVKLNNYYDIMGIDTNYRNLIPIGYMNEFIRLGISTKLEGADGLYYLVRKELRQDQISASLDEISKKLDTVIDNQHQIYSELSSMNQKCDRIVSSTKKSAEISAKNNQLLQEAVKNTSISAYNSERSKQELEFQNFMLMYNN